jgi:hypothetical protein
MNWRRGLFRLWIVGAALFALAVASISYSDIKADFDAVASASKQLKLVTDPKLIEQLEARRTARCRSGRTKSCAWGGGAPIGLRLGNAWQW